LTKPIREMGDEELLTDYRAVKRGNIFLSDDGAVKRYRLALKTEAARRGILPVGEDGEDQNFQKPSAEIFELAVRLGNHEVFEQEIEARWAAG